MSIKEKIIGLIFIIIFAVFAYLISKTQNEIKNNILENKDQTVCKVFRIESRRSFKHVYYYYNYNGIRYERWDNGNVSEDEVLNKFYRVDISTENPSYSKILLDQEVTDSIEIVKAGFKYGSPQTE